MDNNMSNIPISLSKNYQKMKAKNDVLCCFFGQNGWKSDTVTSIAFLLDALQKVKDCICF